MALGENTSGSQTAVISTEHTLATVGAAGMYMIRVNLTNMALGDKLTLRAKSKVRTSDSTDLEQTGRYSHVQTKLVAESIPVPVATASHEVVFTLEQTAGTGRAFSWSVVEI